MFIPPGEKIVEKKICRISGEEFFVTDKDLEFYDKISPIFAGEKYGIPSPTLCPDERQKRRLCFRNERKLHKRKCDKTGQEIISIYSPDKPKIVYEQKIWWSDDWSPFDYGRSFDFERSFFEQIHSLDQAVPVINLINNRAENSDFCNNTTGMKNSYLCCNAIYSEECYYCKGLLKCQKNIDCLRMYNSEECYKSIDCHQCANSRYMYNSIDCAGCHYCYDCIGCRDCMGCVGLRNKQYYIGNKQYLPSEYQKRLQESMTMSPDIMANFLRKIRLQSPQRNLIGSNNESVLGDCIFESSNTYFSFDVSGAENSKYCYDLRPTIKDSHDISSVGDTIENSYEIVSSGIGVNNGLFLNNCWENVHNIFYSIFCLYGCSDCFGSVGLKHGSRCILNTPYSVQEYETLCGKIIDHMKSIGEWGEFFPHSLSPFGYNETVAQEYFPMTESAVKAKGWNWHTEEEKKFEGSVYHPLPISQYDERVVGFDTATKNINECLAGIVQCEVTGKPFKIIKQELAFYIENSLPIPTKHPDQRHKERMNLRNPRTLYERTCSECRKSIITTYAPERPERVVCEECYRKLVY